MKKVLYIFAMALAAASCLREEQLMPVAPDGDIFYASFEDAAKTSMQGCKILWQKGDRISINGYEYEALESGPNVAFQAVSASAPAAETYIAVYPSSLSSLKISGTVVTGSLPAVQIPCQDSVDPSLNYAVAKSETRGTLVFKNILSYFKLTLSEGLPSSFNKVNVTADQIVAGAFSVDYSGSEPVVTPTGTQKLAQLQSSSAISPGVYYIVTLPRTVNSLTANFISGSTTVFSKKTSKEIVLARNEMRNLGILNNFGGGYVLSHEFYVKSGSTNTTGNGQSWGNAVTLSRALTLATTPGDVIYLGAGAYGPSNRITGGATDDDRTFEIKKNITLMGGFPLYPNNSTTLADYDPVNNVTRLDVTNFTDYHACVVTAQKSNNEKVILKGLTLRGGKASGSGSITVGGTAVNRDYGGGLFVGDSNVEVIDCVFKENSGTNAAAMMVAAGGVAKVKNCLFSGNSASAGGGAVVSRGSIYLSGCEFVGNTAGTNGAAVYVPNSGFAAILSSTFHKNTSVAAGSAVYVTGSSANAYLISSTVTGNTVSSPSTSSRYGAVRQASSAKLYVYNSIVSGNVMTGKADTDANLYGTVSGKQSYVNGAVSYNDAGTKMTGLDFSAPSMLSYQSSDSRHITGVYRLSGILNPAVSYGKTPNAILTAVGSSIFTLAELSLDQWGNTRRSGTTPMGAFVSGDPTNPAADNLCNFAAGKFYRCTGTVAPGYEDIYPVCDMADGVKLTDEEVAAAAGSGARAWSGASVTIDISLGSVRPVRQVKVHALTDGSNFLYPSSIQVLAKSGADAPVESGVINSFSGTASDWGTVGFKETNADFIRLVITSANSSKKMMIDEIQVLGNFVEDPKYVPANGAYHAAFNNYTSFKDDPSVSPKFSSCPVDVFDRKVGKPTSMMLWYQTMTPGRNFAEIDKVQGDYAPVAYGEDYRLLMYGFLPQISAAEIASGNLDEYLLDYFTEMKTNQHTERGPIFLRIANEMNGAWTSYSLDPVNYIKAWRRIYNIAEYCRVTSFNVFVWSPNATDSYSNFTNRLENYYPGDIYVDWVGVSCYPPSTKVEKVEDNRYPEVILRRILKVAPNKPFMISEGAYSSDYGQSPEYAPEAQYYRCDHIKWVNQWFNIKNTCNIKAAVWENHLTDSTGDRRIHTDPTALELYRSLVRDSYWLAVIPPEIKEEIRKRKLANEEKSGVSGDINGLPDWGDWSY